MQKQILGVIGGLGPAATAHFMDLVIRMTQADRDQDNLDMIVYDFPSLPDRTDYILGNSLKSPLPEMLSIGRALARQGASVIAVPCVTAHYFYQELAASLPVPVINGVAEAVRLIKGKGIRSAGILATDGTIRSGLISRELDHAGIVSITPSPKRQEDVRHLIYENVKAGKPVDMGLFQAVRQELLACGAEVILLGCTELSLIKRDRQLGSGFLDITEVLALQSVLRCGRQLRPEFIDLL